MGGERWAAAALAAGSAHQQAPAHVFRLPRRFWALLGHPGSHRDPLNRLLTAAGPSSLLRMFQRCGQAVSDSDR